MRPERRHFVVYFSGKGMPSSADRLRLLRTPGLQVLDDSDARVLLVEAVEADLRRSLGRRGRWRASLVGSFGVEKGT